MSGIVDERPRTAAPGPPAVDGDVTPPQSGPPPIAQTDRSLWMVRRIGFVVLGVQAVGLLIWSAVIYRRFAVGSDYGGYDQAWFLMAHGHLNPTVSIWGGHLFLKSHAEIIMVLLAPLWWVSHSGVTLLWVADAALVVAECVTFLWMCEVAAKRPGRGGWQLAGLGLFFLVANPWMYWALSFDFHAETLGACFALLAAYDLAHHHKRAWVWVALCLCCGDVCATYIAGVGISAVLAGKPWRRQGLVFIGLGAAFTGVVTLIGANSGSGLASYVPPSTGGAGGAARGAAGGVSGTAAGHAASGSAAGGAKVTHTVRSSGVTGLSSVLSSPFKTPGKFFHDLWPNKLNIYANLAPAGGIGIFSAWGFGVPALVLLENNLRGGFSVTAAQNIPMYCFVSLGTVMVLSRIARWKPVVAVVVGVLLALSTLGWFIVWFPTTRPQWLRVNPAAAAAIARATPSIPANAEVIAAHGVEGALSARETMYALGSRLPVSAHKVFIVSAPSQGIEITPLSKEISDLGQVAKLGGRLISSGGGAWVFEWTPPPGRYFKTLPSCNSLPAWAMSSRVGKPYTKGPVSGWGMVATGGKGYVIYGAYDREPPGNHDAVVSMTSHGPLSVEVWDSDRKIILGRRIVAATGAQKTVVVPYVTPPQQTRSSTSGQTLFRVIPITQPPYDQIEVRIYSAGGVRAKISAVSYQQAPAQGHSATTPTIPNC